ncbi:MAG: 1-hydroxycarotenoid 3,4-desaturase CrtD, partial [Pseudomonadota bacterium]
VHVVEAADHPGGKLRTVPSDAGPVDAGPTVMTLRPVFENLFAEAGLAMADYVTTVQEPLLARHWWPDGASLDLFADMEASAAAMRDFGGAGAEADFTAFHARTGEMFRAFERPVMQSAKPEMGGILGACLRAPGMTAWLMPGRTMAGALAGAFRDPRLRQLFGRYATYVGGSPYQSPALLSLIWQAEAAGVWRVEGGMAALAAGVAKAAADLGVRFSYGRAVERVRPTGAGFDVIFRDDGREAARTVVFNGDPAALRLGLLDPGVGDAVTASGVRPRSLSAYVWSFAARPGGADLSHHNVFFNEDYRSEFAAVTAGEMPGDAALYVCAQDRGVGLAPDGPERFEIIMNAAPVTSGDGRPREEFRGCLTRTFETLSRRGLDFDTEPQRINLTTPHDFAARFPGSAGSLYGRSPHGMMASFQRPVVRSRIPGLYLAGGGVHPGAGLPMAATSGRLAAEAILTDRASTSRSRRTAMPGGMSTGFPTAAATASRSSPS